MSTVVRVATGLAILLAAAATAAVGEADAPDPVQGQMAGGLPASLDMLYPPKADGPVWLFAMFGMGTSFSGMTADFMEGDFANAEKGYADFRAQYGKLSKMVPEWAADVPAEPMDALGAALESRDPGQFMPAVERAAMVCHNCHVKNMTRVQQKYHWGDFGGIALTDPVSGSDVSFTMLMRMLDGDLAGVQVDVSQGQIAQARKHAEGLAARFDALQDACEACHDSERRYFVDSSVTGVIRDLAGALGGETADPAMVQKQVQTIGIESCHKCHLVHGPAALARYSAEPAGH